MNVPNHNRLPILFRFFPAVLLVVLAAILVAPNAMACHRLDKNGDPKPHGKIKDCEPSQPQQFPADQEMDTAGFFDKAANQKNPHFKSGEMNFSRQGLSADSGDFVLDDQNASILLDTGLLSKLQLKGSPRIDWCRMLDGNTTWLYPESFSYSWVDDCTDGNCAAEFRLTISDGIDLLTYGESDRLDLVMYATINIPDQDPSAPIVNPFSIPQDLALYIVEGEYMKPGTTRSIAKCRWTQSGSGVPHFYSVPRD